MSLTPIDYDLFAYGDGSDGDVTVTTAITLSRNMYYRNLTLSGSGTIDANGFCIFAWVIAAETSSNKIFCNGGDANGTVGGLGGKQNFWGPGDAGQAGRLDGGGF